MMVKIDEDDYHEAVRRYKKLWDKLPLDLQRSIPANFYQLMIRQTLWAPVTHTDGRVVLITEWGQKKVEMLLSPHAETLFKVYALQANEKVNASHAQEC